MFTIRMNDVTMLLQLKEKCWTVHSLVMYHSGEGMGKCLMSKMFRTKSQREKKQQDIFVFSFVQKEGQSSSIVLSPYLDDLWKPRCEASESEIQEVETRREDGPEAGESEDDIWALLSSLAATKKNG